MRGLKKFFLLIFVFLLFAFFFLAPKLIRIEKIDCRSQFGPCNKNLEDALLKVIQDKPNLAQAKKNLSAVLNNEVLVYDFSYQFKIPNTLKINVLERKAKFALKNRQNQALALLDKDGMVIYYQEATNLPTLTTSELVPNVGERVDEETLFALNLLSNIFSFYQVKEGKIENKSLVIELPSSYKVIFPLEGDQQVLLGSLRLVLAKLNTQAQESRIKEVFNAKTIDLRFKNPVVR